MDTIGMNVSPTKKRNWGPELELLYFHFIVHCIGKWQLQHVARCISNSYIHLLEKAMYICATHSPLHIHISRIYLETRFFEVCIRLRITSVIQSIYYDSNPLTWIGYALTFGHNCSFLLFCYQFKPVLNHLTIVQ